MYAGWPRCDWRISYFLAVSVCERRSGYVCPLHSQCKLLAEDILNGDTFARLQNWDCSGIPRHNSGRVDFAVAADKRFRAGSRIEPFMYVSKIRIGCIL